MTLKDDMAKAKKAREKLVKYAGGLPKGAGTDKFDELNAEADKAIRKLPKILQSRLAEDLFW